MVDPAAGVTNGVILNRGAEVYDVMLSLVDVSQNTDKYYLLQVISSPQGSYHTWARWGRTGTAGQSQRWDHDDEDQAVEIFAEKFKEKTGLDWEGHAESEAVEGKYRVLKMDHVARAAKTPVKWQYYVEDGVDGKADGWYDYDDAASVIVEQLHDEWLYNRDMSQRLVASGDWMYRLNLQQMQQTNSSTGKVRTIRRVVLAKGPGKNSRSNKRAAAAPPSPPSSRSPSPPPPPPAPATPAKGKRGAAAAAAAAAVAVVPAAAGGRKRGAPAAPPPAPSPPAKKGKTAATASAPAAPATPAKGQGKKVPAAAPTPTPTKSKAAVASAEVDPACPLAGTGSVVGEYDVMLNQTNIGANNNKFYKAQLVESGGKYHLWTRWGRVGEPGQSQLQGPMDLEGGEKAFKDKFKDKTGNKFDERDSFTPKAKKYDLVLLKKEKEEEEEDVKPGVKVKVESAPPSQLDPTTRDFINFIFSENMFKDAMSHLDLDVKRMPLGRLSEEQVHKGFEVLESIEDELNSSNDANTLQELSGKFYTVIPHSFGRSKPPVINSLAMVQQKYDLCNVLLDIEAAQQMTKNSEARVQDPADSHYAELAADLELLDPLMHKKRRHILEKYMENTLHNNIKGGYCKGVKLLNVWEVNRHGEDARFQAHDKITNRKLLWHGTNVAVVAAILKSGLRIMPHSGGRVGSGIYLASEAAKSVNYVGPARGPSGKQWGIFFLVEAALGKEYSITQDDSSLKAPPPGYDSVVARGHQEPDPSADHRLYIDERPVTVPWGVPKTMPQYSKSSFDQSEYLIYKESQHRIRYVVTVEMP